ncbi:MAG: PepSY domain-containing protein [Gemmata sp.]
MHALSRYLLAVVVGAALVGPTRADDKKPEKPQPGTEPGKPLIIQIDASKLPPELLKQLLQMAEKPASKPGSEPVKPGTKPGAEPVKPVKPGTEPVKPVKPGTEPVKPGTEPVKPGAEPVKPVKPGTEPVKPVKPGTEPVKPVKPGTEPVKPGTEPNKLKTISLAEAIGIAEKSLKATVVKAEREEEDGKVEFELQLRDANGGKLEVTLDAAGNVVKKQQKGVEKGNK